MVVVGGPQPVCGVSNRVSRVPQQGRVRPFSQVDAAVKNVPAPLSKGRFPSVPQGSRGACVSVSVSVCKRMPRHRILLTVEKELREPQEKVNKHTKRLTGR